LNEEIISVTKFVSIFNETLRYAFPKILIEGEVSSFTVWQNRFIYFDLKDEKTTINCFIGTTNLSYPIENGMRVVVEGGPTLTAKGKFSISVRGIRPTGEGAIKRAFELLKKKLDSEGMFDDERKRELPRFPQRVGLITAGGSAAYADFIKIAHSRWPALDIEFSSVQVQGNVAANQIIQAIKIMNESASPLEALVIIRGGGSLEDLQAFNNEGVVRAIAASRIPTIVGVGHEVDTSLADLVADQRAATPTDAAMRLVPDVSEVLAHINRTGEGLHSELILNIQHLQARLVRCENVFELMIRARINLLYSLEQSLHRNLNKLILDSSQKVEHQARILSIINPRTILRRGYSIVRAGNKIVTSTKDLIIGEELMIELSTGKITSSIKGIEHGKG
jgi:exodeoxyribonuclease VII large subunit